MNNKGAREMWIPLHVIKITKLMTLLLVQDMVTCLNMFPSQNGISSGLVTEEIILGSPNPYYTKIRITFVTYSQLYIGTTNSTKQIIVGEITAPRKLMRRALIHLDSQWETDPYTYMDRVENKR